VHGPWSERLDFRKFAHSFAPGLKTLMLEALFKVPEYTLG
jgi:hypothetical protein